MAGLSKSTWAKSCTLLMASCRRSGMTAQCDRLLYTGWPADPVRSSQGVRIEDPQVKKYREIWPSLQANNLAWHTFADMAKDTKHLSQRQRLITHSTASTWASCLPWFSLSTPRLWVPKGWHGEPHDAVGLLRKSDLGTLNLLHWVTNEPALPLSLRETLLCWTEEYGNAGDRGELSPDNNIQ